MIFGRISHRIDQVDFGVLDEGRTEVERVGFFNKRNIRNRK
jgi:hypothetical protein